MIKLILILTILFSPMNPSSIYQFTVNDLSGKPVSLKHYENKVLLIVNTASECGFTPQYEELEILYNLYKSKGFEVLAFPSNDFGGQEPLDGMEIQQFCSVKFHTTFPIFDKVHVKGKDADPLFVYLSNKSENGAVNIAPKWNFQKYLIDKHGKVVDYYLSTTSPTSTKVKKEIERLLQQK